MRTDIRECGSTSGFNTGMSYWPPATGQGRRCYIGHSWQKTAQGIDC